MEDDDAARHQELLHWMRPDETAADVLSRTVKEAMPSGLPLVDQYVSLRPGQALEIVGPTASGKSELLLQVLVHFLAAQQVAQSAAAPGSSAVEGAAAPPGHVLLIDLHSKFDLVKVAPALRAAAAAQHVQGAGADVWVNEAMDRFHMVRCRNSCQLLAVLATLPLTIAERQISLRMVLIDSIGAFSWQDRASRAAPSLGGAGGVEPPLTLQRVHAALALLLTSLCVRHRAALVATKQAQVTERDTPQGPQLTQREYLPSAWQQLVAHRLLLHPVGDPPAAVVMAQWQGLMSIGPLSRLPPPAHHSAQ